MMVDVGISTISEKAQECIETIKLISRNDGNQESIHLTKRSHKLQIWESPESSI